MCIYIYIYVLYHTMYRYYIGPIYIYIYIGAIAYCSIR